MSTVVQPKRPRAARFARAAAMGALALVVVAVPTDIIDTPLFGREIPVRWWEYPVVGLTVALTVAWFALPGSAASTSGRGRPLGGILLTVFAVGCPVCNKLVLAALGTSGALGLWAPLQPFLAVISLALLTFAVVRRRGQSTCDTGSCAPETTDAQPTAVRQ
ncbi:hypothetical protein ABZ639_09935 [Saccharomonospora sp. NPDC006951]